MVCNGEIFNHRALRHDLAAKKYCFQTDSDCEVILHLYAEYGIQGFTQLEGQFAFALWDERSQKLVLARDRHGILPLFFQDQRANGGGVSFASEIKSILAVNSCAPEANLAAIKQIFTFWSPLEGETPFKNIQQVKPGHALLIQGNKTEELCYWDWSFPDNHQFINNEKEALEGLQSLLTESVSSRLQADVPVASLLSGGLDSSSVIAIARDLGHKPDTYSITFSDSKEHDESSFQAQLLERYPGRHTVTDFKSSSIVNYLEETLWHTEMPLLRMAPGPIRQLSSSINEDGLKVALTGEGADEVLGGYDLFKETKIRQFWAKQPSSALRPKLLQRLYPYLNGWLTSSDAYLQSFFKQGLDQPNHPLFSHLPRWSTTQTCQQFFSEEMRDATKDHDPLAELTNRLPEAFQDWHWFNKAQYLEAHTLLSTYILPSQSDRMLMANSVEGRYPFLNHKLIEFCNQLHPKLKMRGLNEKWLLKQLMATRLPPEIINRPKQPYRAPDAAAFAHPRHHDWLNELLSPSNLLDCGYFDPTKVGFLLKKLQNKQIRSQKDNMALVGIITTQLWHRAFIQDYNKRFR